MAQEQKSGSDSKTEYVVKCLPQGSKKDAKGQNHMQTTDMTKATEEAERLHKTGKYRLVEVTYEFHDPKKDRIVEMSLTKHEKKDRSALINAGLFITTLALGAGAFVLTYYLARAK
jgi:hypothetical protein